MTNSTDNDNTTTDGAETDGGGVDYDAARIAYLDQRVEPHITHLFDCYDWMSSIGLLVSQYYCDEAYDAVHAHLICSQYPTPRLEALWDAEQGDSYGMDDAIDPNIPAGLEGRHGGTLDQWELTNFNPDTGKFRSMSWDDNGTAIPLFGAFCDPGSQEGDDRNQRPYALWRRNDDGDITRTIVGVKVRPWLDGVVSEDYD